MPLNLLDAKGSINVHLEKLEKTFLVTVTDNGIGIPRSLQPILFEKYTKAGREGLEGEDTVGLGHVDRKIVYRGT